MDNDQLAIAVMRLLAFREMSIKELEAELKVPREKLKTALFFLERSGHVGNPVQGGGIIDLIRMKYWLTKEGYKHLQLQNRPADKQNPSNVVIAGQINNLIQGDVTTINIDALLIEIYNKIERDETLSESRKQDLKQKFRSLVSIMNEIKQIGYPASGQMLAELIAKIFGI